MKRIFKLDKKVLLFLSMVLLLTSCSSGKATNVEETKNSSEEKKVIKIGCMESTEPMVENIAEGLEKKGYTVETVMFDGNHLPATALKDGSVDGVILNHLVWLNIFNKENDSNLVMPEPYMYYGRNAMYSSKYDNVEDIPNGATIAVPGDPANLDRSLKILEKLNLIKLGEKTGELYNKVDIVENIKDIEILETEITTTARSINDVDAVISGVNSVKKAGHDHTKYLYDDPSNKDYPLGLIVRDEDKDLDWVKEALDYQQSEEFKTKFNDHYDYTYVLFD